MEPGRKTRLRVLRGYDDFNPGHSAALAMVRIVRSFTDAHTRIAREHDLNLPRLEILLCLRAGEGISQQELSQRLLVTKGNVSMTLQAMEAEGQPPGVLAVLVSDSYAEHAAAPVRMCVAASVHYSR